MGLCRALRRLHRRGATQYCCVGACGSEDPGNDPLHGNHGRCTWQSNSYSGLSTVGVWSGGRSPFFSVLAVVLGLYWAGKRNASYRRTTGCTRGGDRVRDDGWVTRAARVPRVVAPDGRILKRMLTENPSTPRQAPTTNPTIASPGRERAPRTAHHPVLSSCGDRGVCMLALGRDQRTDGLPARRGGGTANWIVASSETKRPPSSWLRYGRPALQEEDCRLPSVASSAGCDLAEELMAKKWPGLGGMGTCMGWSFSCPNFPASLNSMHRSGRTRRELIVLLASVGVFIAVVGYHFWLID